MLRQNTFYATYNIAKYTHVTSSFETDLYTYELYMKSFWTTLS